MEKYCRSDLACELCSDIQALPDGVQHVREIRPNGFTVERLFVPSDTDKSKGGNYITIECGRIQELEASELSALSRLVCDELLSLTYETCGKKVNGDLKVLVVGLGNSDMTPDAIGPETVRKIDATAHLKELAPELFSTLECCRLYLTSPGVLGQTGIETQKLVIGATEACSPDVIVIIDALAARSPERLAATVQLSDTGISPGSGIGNKRDALKYETLGVPVISLGVPTLTDSSSLVYDALKCAGIGEDEISDELTRVLENGRSYFVSPKDCDAVTEYVSDMLSDAIANAFGIKTYLLA